MHLELGTLPIKKRRILFLQYILKQSKHKLIYKFFEAQADYPQKGDWVMQVRKDLIDVKIDLNFDIIKSMSENEFKQKVTESIKYAAFSWLLSKISDKGSDLSYNDLKIQDYFLYKDMNIKQRNLLFSLRARMLPVKCNFRKKYDDLTSPVCLDKNKQDTQSHILECKVLLKGENILVKNNVSYNDIFSRKAAKQLAIVKL